MKYFDDVEKFRDFLTMNKDDFLNFYSYLKYEDYEYYKEKIDYFKNNYELKLLKVHKDTNADFSILLEEQLTQKQFWIDCFEIEDEKGFYNWDFNKYIFFLDNSIDLEDKFMQELFLSYEILEGFDCLIDEFVKSVLEVE